MTARRRCTREKVVYDKRGPAMVKGDLQELKDIQAGDVVTRSGPDA